MNQSNTVNQSSTQSAAIRSEGLDSGGSANRDRLTLILVVATALLPWPDRWALLKTLVPLALILLWARSSRGSLADLGLHWMRP